MLHEEFQYLIRYKAAQFTQDRDLMEDLMQTARIALYKAEDTASQITDVHKRRVYIVKTIRGVMLRYLTRVNPLIFIPNVPFRAGKRLYTTLFCEMPEYRHETRHSITYEMITRMQIDSIMPRLSPESAWIIKLRLREYTDLEIIKLLGMSKYHFQICRNAAIETLRSAFADEQAA